MENNSTFAVCQPAQHHCIWEASMMVPILVTWPFVRPVHVIFLLANDGAL